MLPYKVSCLTIGTLRVRGRERERKKTNRLGRGQSDPRPSSAGAYYIEPMGYAVVCHPPSSYWGRSYFRDAKKGRRQKKRLGGGRAPSRIVAVHKGYKGGRVNQQ